MPDENRFAGLTDAMEEEAEADEPEADEAEADEATDDAGEPAADAESAADADSGSDSAAGSESAAADADEAEDADAEGDAEGGAAPDDGETADDVDPAEVPAFAFEEASPKSIYVRDETLALLEDAEFEVEAALRRDRQIRNVTGREFHDAAVRVIADHAEEVAEEIVRLREEE
ncbi:hypothetical protein GCM10027435_20660 [Haloparvum alkalitolerans]|uniref:hypothetical protein n=1 Tax=Haloparvum alkalitolerans TaxID=1042953 RepID=UPI003CE6C19A